MARLTYVPRPPLSDHVDFLWAFDADGGLHAHDHAGFRSFRRGHSRTMTRMGVGLKPLQGLRVCGQLEITASTSISARSST
jgi:hypothetical protein